MIQKIVNRRQKAEGRKIQFLPVIILLIAFLFPGACDKKAAPTKAAACKAAKEGCSTEC